MFKEKHQIYTFYHKIMSLLDEGHEIYNFLSEYASQVIWKIFCQVSYFFKDGHNGRQTTYEGEP